MSRVKSFYSRHFCTILATGCLLLVLLSWWHSSRYSERHLHFVGKRSVEVFSASSLVRFSFANGHIGSPHQQRGYRQRNARGKFLIRPLVPVVRIQPGLWELTIGCWHAAALALIGVGIAAGVDTRRRRRATGRN